MIGRLLLVLVLWLSCWPAQALAAEWTAVSARGGIGVWTRQPPGAPLKEFRGRMDVDKPLPHIRLDAALEFLIGDKLR